MEDRTQIELIHRLVTDRAFAEAVAASGEDALRRAAIQLRDEAATALHWVAQQLGTGRSEEVDEEGAFKRWCLDPFAEDIALGKV